MHSLSSTVHPWELGVMDICYPPSKTSLVCTWWYFEKCHFEIFSYKNPTSALNCTCVLNSKILSKLLAFLSADLLYHQWLKPFLF